MLTPEIKETIFRLIHSGNLLNSSLEKAAKELNILPLFPSGDGWYGINLDGDIVSASSDEPYKLSKECDPVTINVTLFQGIKKYPELSALSPIRTENDLTCPFCNGTGEHPLAKTINVLCYCGGVGWIPHNAPKIDQTIEL